MSAHGSFSLSVALLVFACLWLLPSYRIDHLTAGIFLMLSSALTLWGKAFSPSFSDMPDTDAAGHEKAGMRWSEEREFAHIVQPLLAHPAVEKLACYRHHRTASRLEHSVDVAWLSYLAARRLSLDYAAAARGALLHDLFFYDRSCEGPRMHVFRHPATSLRNARIITPLTGKEEDIIRKHMWPLTIVPPRYPESWIVCFADTCCSIRDLILHSRHIRERFLSN